MKAALAMANTQVDYINAHGTSTKYNDYYETLALKKVVNGSVPPVSATKGQIGHCLGAAGGLEAVISIMAMQKGILHPTINQTQKDHDCALDYISNVDREAKIDTIMSNSFSFGGTNGVGIFKRG